MLVDFKRAFDLVDHQILLNKLDINGIKDEALMWFNTFLTNRKQQVSENNTSLILSKFHMECHKVLYKGHCYFYYLLMIYHYT